MLIGPEQADVTFVSWGSTKSVLDQTLYDLGKMNTGKTMNFIHLPCVCPFPAAKFMELASKAKHLVMIEGNFTGQCEMLIRQETGLTFTDRIRRYDGRPFYSEDIIQWLQK
jgi:2-oxoglutarate ferredoxin oxidoreductase subunit alpha